MSNFVNEFAWFYKRRGARAEAGVVLTPWDDVVGVTVPADHFWSFDDGDYTDLVGSLDMAATGTVSNVAGPGGLVGAAGMVGAANRLGASDATLPAPFDSRSFACWFKPNAIGATHIVFSYGQSGINFAFIVAVSVAGKLEFSQYGDSVVGTTVLSAGVWYHLAASIELVGGNPLPIKLYVNGAVDGTGNNTINTQLGGNAYFGADPSAATGMDGAVSQAVFEGGIWSDSHVALLYNGGVPFGV